MAREQDVALLLTLPALPRLIEHNPQRKSHPQNKMKKAKNAEVMFVNNKKRTCWIRSSKAHRNTVNINGTQRWLRQSFILLIIVAFSALA
jgi:hypothetical protein